jgi:NADPH:quinone reductase-like Zn-dependent oxidoreductase
MLAVRLHEYGGVDQLRLDEVPRPEPRADEVLIHIAATSVNPIDCKQRAGLVQKRLPLSLPIILGCDFAGTIAEVGSAVGDFQTGDEVFGYCGVQRDGTYAEYVSRPAAHIALKPRSMTMVQAGALPLAAITAYIALFEAAGLQRDQSVLVHAAAGGVGSMAVQLAKHAGATVYAAGSSGSEALIRSLGADVFIDYGAVRFEDAAREMNVVLDTIGGETQARSWECLIPNGFMAAVATPPSPDLMRRYRCRGARPAARPDGTLLARLAELVDAGQLKVIIDSIFRLLELGAAQLRSETGHVHGKISILVP